MRKLVVKPPFKWPEISGPKFLQELGSGSLKKKAQSKT
jgi:hypothetical protein